MPFSLYILLSGMTVIRWLLTEYSNALMLKNHKASWLKHFIHKMSLQIHSLNLITQNNVNNPQGHYNIVGIILLETW